MAITLLSVPTNHQTRFSTRPYSCYNNSNPWLNGLPPIIRYPSKSIIIPLCSSSPSSTPVIEDGPLPHSSQDDAIPLQSDSAIEDSDKLIVGGCKACGRLEIERGCNGEGRIQGGIATVPGFGWWPVKAHRPCHGFVASGGRYRRRGQSMDEVAFWRGRKERAAVRLNPGKIIKSFPDYT